MNDQIRLDIDELLIAAAHYFKHRGGNDNWPPNRCLACGLLRSHPVHGDGSILRQNNADASYMAGLVLAWPGPGSKR